MKYFFWPKYHNKIQQLQHWYGQCNSKGMSLSTKWATKLCNCSKFLQLSFAYNPAFYFNIGKKLWRHISFFSTCFCYYRKQETSYNNENKISSLPSSSCFQQHFHDWFYVLRYNSDMVKLEWTLLLFNFN